MMFLYYTLFLMCAISRFTSFKYTKLADLL